MHRALLEGAVVILGLIVLAAIITWPLVLHMGSRIYGYPGDSTGTISFLWLSARNGFDLLERRTES